MFTPVKPIRIGELNDTIVSTPQPQATSTVQRKSTYVLECFELSTSRANRSPGTVNFEANRSNSFSSLFAVLCLLRDNGSYLEYFHQSNILNFLSKSLNVTLIGFQAYIEALY